MYENEGQKSALIVSVYVSFGIETTEWRYIITLFGIDELSMVFVMGQIRTWILDFLRMYEF